MSQSRELLMQFGPVNGFCFYCFSFIFYTKISFEELAWHVGFFFSSSLSSLFPCILLQTSSLAVKVSTHLLNLPYVCVLQIQWWSINNYWSLDISRRETGARQANTGDNTTWQDQIIHKIVCGRERSGDLFWNVWYLSTVLKNVR